MSDIETNAFKEAANGKLHRSGHSNKAIGGDIDVSGSTSYKRTSKQIWLSDVETTTTDNNSTQKGFPSYNAEAFRVGLHNYYSKTQFKGKKYIHLIPFFLDSYVPHLKIHSHGPSINYVVSNSLIFYPLLPSYHLLYLIGPI